MNQLVSANLSRGIPEHRHDDLWNSRRAYTGLNAERAFLGLRGRVPRKADQVEFSYKNGGITLMTDATTDVFAKPKNHPTLLRRRSHSFAPEEV